MGKVGRLRGGFAMRNRLIAAVLLASAAAGAARAQSVAETEAALRDRAMAGSGAFAIVESLTTEIGPRPIGSPAQARAMHWGLAKLKALGFQNVHVEPFTAPGWARGAESAEVIAPYPQRLAVLALGGSVPTPAGGIEAEIVLFKSYPDLLAAPLGSLAGKIAVVVQPMVETEGGEGYGAGITMRAMGASEAAKRGAVAYLFRSLSTASSRLPHTGFLHYATDAPKIPAAALSVPDAELLARMAARGAPVRVRLSLQNTLNPAVQAWNVVGEVPGGERPDEVIVIGGHLDSWDPGTGALDDGAGLAITVAAGKLIADLPQHPKRTVRVVLFGAEEMGGFGGGDSGAAYADAHKAEVAKIVLAGESDEGDGAAWSLQLPAGAAAAPAMQGLAGVLAPIRIFVDREPAMHSGSDVEGLARLGVPMLAIKQDARRYFDFHHSADDTLDKVDPKGLDQNVAAWAAAVYAAAESDADFRAAAAKP
jgi:Zn-dependent M28 family amino/carboxypeptidase